MLQDVIDKLLHHAFKPVDGRNETDQAPAWTGELPIVRHALDRAQHDLELLEARIHAYREECVAAAQAIPVPRVSMSRMVEMADMD